MVLFQLEVSGDDDVEEVLRYHAAEGAATPDVAAFAGQLVRGVIANRAQRSDRSRAHFGFGRARRGY